MSDNNVLELKSVSVYHSKHPYARFSSRRSKDKGDLVLTDVNITLGAGEILYLIGKVGSGKSTLLKTLYGEVPLYEGSGNVVGFDLGSLKRSHIPKLRRKLGIVFQDYQLLTDRNVFDNLHYVMRATGWSNETDMRRKIAEVLDLVGLHHKEYKMPFELSGGEQQRLSIARAMINDPKLIIADEPTGNLDPAASEGIMDLFKTIADNGCSIIMSTHNIRNIEQHPSRTLRFSRGYVEPVDINSILGL